MSDPHVFPEHEVPAIKRVMMPRDTNALGTIFGGVILSEIDLAAAIEAHRHHTGKLVTVGMNEIKFHQPVFVGDLVSFFTSTDHIGTTSVTVRVEVWSERRFSKGENVYVTEALVTLVAVDQDFKKTPLQCRSEAPSKEESE